jgi:large subunit ribosomal protein L25
MSKQDIILELGVRDTIGKGLNTLRKAGNVPAIINSPGKDSVAVSGAYNEVQKVYKQAGKHHPITIEVGKESYFTIIKDVDFDPKKNTIRHIVFSTIKQNEKVETEVPVHLVGDAPAQKAGLLVIKQLDQVKLEAFPRNLPDNVEVSVESLSEVGDKVTVADIIVQSGVTILTDIEHPVASVEETPAQISEEAAEETSTAESEGEATEQAETQQETPAE